MSAKPIRKKFNLKEWFFAAFTRPPAKRPKPSRYLPMDANAYERRGASLYRKHNRKFRRGRAWQGGKLVRAERWKFWSR